MRRFSHALLLLSVLTVAACAMRTPPATQPTAIGIPSLKHTDADVHFMTGMIHHHAQAVLIARWALTHAASAELQRLCERIIVAQSDEIELMQRWLKEKGAPVPEATPGPMKMVMAGGMTHEMLMPGMLTDDELKAIDAARGAEFDRLFLTGMIKHHEGALTMVDELFASQGAGQDETVFRFASDVFADQTTEIRVMQQMLAAREKAGSR